MTDEQDTGNPARLPLADRARRGDDLEIHEILELEFPGGGNPDDQRRWRQLIEQAIRFDVLPTRLEADDDGCLPATELICRRDYLARRDRQSGLPVNSLIEAWRPSASEPDPPVSGAAAARETELQMHKRECQDIGNRLWAENQNFTKADIMKHTDMQFYVRSYKGKNTIPGWLAEIDPRPKDKRRGRPKKIPV